MRVFLNHRGAPLTRFGVRYLFRKYLDHAKTDVPLASPARDCIPTASATAPQWLS